MVDAVKTQGLIDAKQILTQLQQGIGSGGDSFNASEFFKIGNMLNGSVSDVEALTNGNGTPEQQANAIKSMLDRVMSLIEKFTTGEADSAKSETGKQIKNSNKTNQEALKAGQVLDAQFLGIQGGIEQQQGIIDNSKKILDDKQQEIEKKQEEVQKLMKDLQQLQQDLAATTDPEKQKELLISIQGLSGQIATSITSIANIKQEVETASQNVETSFATIASLNDQAVQVQENGESKIKGLYQAAAVEAKDNTETQVKKLTNDVTAQVAGSAASAASSNIFTGASIAPKLYKTEFDQQMASTIRQVGSSLIGSTLTSLVGAIGNNAQLLGRYNETIGNALSNYSSSIGSWNGALEPLITSIGSFDSIDPQIKELNTAVETDFKTVETQLDTKKAQNNNGQTEQNDKKAKNNDFNNMLYKAGGAEWLKPEEQVNNLETPKVKVQFGL